MLALAAQGAAPDWAAFGRAGALSHVTERVKVRTARPAIPNRVEYELIYTRDGVEKREIFSASSSACPAVRAVLASMRDLTMPRPAPYGVAGESDAIVLDGTTYTLSVPTDFPSGRMTISSSQGSPLAAWIDNAFKALEPCWSKTV